MGRKILKWFGIVLGGLLGLAILAAVILWAIGTSKVNRTYDVRPEPIELPTDEASLQRGEFLVDNCRGCHGENLGGEVFVEEPGLLTLYSANLTTGEGGAARQDVGQLVLAIRHGIDSDGTGLLVMPSEILNHLSREDLGAIIAYLQTVAPIDHVVPEPRLQFLGRVVIAAGVIPGEVIPAAVIDHERPYTEMPKIGVNAEYGGYMAHLYGCITCHGEDLSGGPIPFDQEVVAANLTPAGELTSWSEEDFVQTLLTGVTPSGRELNSEYMPVLEEDLDVVTDDHLRDLRAIWTFLQSLPSDG